MSQASPVGPIEEVIGFFAQGPSREEIARFRLSNAAQEHVRELLDKDETGTLTREEARELDKIMVLNEVVSLIRAHAHASSAQHAAHTAVPGA